MLFRSTITYLREKGARVVLLSHLGRPKGGPDPQFSLKQIVPALEKLLGAPVEFIPDPATGAATTPIFGDPVQITGLHLVDGRASYGFGLETFALGFPIHFDWAWRTLLNRDYEDAVFAAVGGSHEYRRPQFKVWIGFDF